MISPGPGCPRSEVIGRDDLAALARGERTPGRRAHRVLDELRVPVVIAAARRTSPGRGVGLDRLDAPPAAGPSSCSEAAAVPLDPSMIEAIDWGGPSTNAPLAATDRPASPGFALPGEPSPVQKW